jgi:basic amino acid/polyamine antiporter, APA family
MPEPNAASPSGAPAASEAAPKRQLTLFDSTCIIVGIIIGVGIYESTPLIASSVPSVGWLIGVWLLGGLLSLLGALCYAELATAYPEEGGDYVYLTRGFGRAHGFLFAWAQLWVVRPGSIGAMAYVFGRYADQLVPLSNYLARWYPSWQALVATGEMGAEQLEGAAAAFGRSLSMLVYAALAVVILSVINILGVREGKWTQNILTTAKVLGLLAVVAAGLLVAPRAAAPPTPDVIEENTGLAAASPRPDADAAEPAGGEGPAVEQPADDKAKPFDLSAFLSSLGLAMIFVLYAYGGWNEMAYVGAEVRNPQKNILRALVLGTVAVCAIYVLVTIAFLGALGFQGVRDSGAIAAELLGMVSEKWGAWAISLLVCVSALGAINGQIFTGGRIYYAMGREHRLYARLGKWSAAFGTPVASLVIQAVITLGLIVGFGLLQAVGRSEGGFHSMVIFTAPVFWFFLVLVGISVGELRDREPATLRPYRVPGYPITPFLFCLSSLFMLYSSVTYAVANQSWEALWAVLIMVAGVGMCFWDPRPRAELRSPSGR